jgi:hypothetical protein
MSAILEVADNLFEDPRFEADKCGPAGGHTLLVLLIRASSVGSPVFDMMTARELCRASDPDAVIDSLVTHGFLRRDGEQVVIVDAPDLWRLA